MCVCVHLLRGGGCFWGVFLTQFIEFIAHFSVTVSRMFINQCLVYLSLLCLFENSTSNFLSDNAEDTSFFW